jgi:hypothetical protein
VASPFPATVMVRESAANAATGVPPRIIRQRMAQKKTGHRVRGHLGSWDNYTAGGFSVKSFPGVKKKIPV